MKKDTGGPAFPAGMIKKSKPRHDPGADFEVTDIVSPKQEGMTLRDYFAAKAMAAYIAAMHGNPPEPETTSECAYFMADAMIAERSK